MIIERLLDGRAKAFSQARAQDLAVCDPVCSDDDVFVTDERLHRGVEMRGLNPARLQVATIDVAGQVAVASQELLAAPDGIFKRKIFQTVKRVVVNEGPHRPVLRDDFAGEADDASQLHPSRFDVGPILYLFHLIASTFALVGGVVLSGPNRFDDAPPSASRTRMTITKEANSVRSRSV